MTQRRRDPLSTHVQDWFERYFLQRSGSYDRKPPAAVVGVTKAATNSTQPLLEDQSSHETQENNDSAMNTEPLDRPGGSDWLEAVCKDKPANLAEWIDWATKHGLVRSIRKLSCVRVSTGKQASSSRVRQFLECLWTAWLEGVARGDILLVPGPEYDNEATAVVDVADSKQHLEQRRKGSNWKVVAARNLSTHVAVPGLVGTLSHALPVRKQTRWEETGRDISMVATEHKGTRSFAAPEPHPLSQKAERKATGTASHNSRRNSLSNQTHSNNNSNSSHNSNNSSRWIRVSSNDPAIATKPTLRPPRSQHDNRQSIQPMSTDSSNSNSNNNSKSSNSSNSHNNNPNNKNTTPRKRKRVVSKKEGQRLRDTSDFRKAKRARVEYRVMSGNACLLNHACSKHANVTAGVLAWQGRSKTLHRYIWHKFETLRPIKAGEELTLCYAGDREHDGFPCASCLTATRVGK